MRRIAMSSPKSWDAVRRSGGAPSQSVGRSRVIIAALGLAALPWSVLQTIAAAIVPQVNALYGGSRDVVGWIVTGYVLAGVAGNLLAGPVGSRLGIRRAMLLALGIAELGAVLAAVATTVQVLIVGRVLQGVCAAAIPLTYTQARVLLERRDQGRAFSVLASLFNVGGLVGLMVAGPIADFVSVSAIFWLASIVIGLAVVATLTCLPCVEDTDTSKGDLYSASLLLAALCCLLASLQRMSTGGVGDTRAVALLLACLLVTLFWVRRNHLSGRRPITDLSSLRSDVMANVLASLALGIAIYAPLLVVPELIVSARFGLSLSPSSIGLVMLPASVAGITASLFWPRLMARYGVRAVSTVGCLALLLGYLLIVLGHRSLAFVLVSQAAQGCGLAMALGGCMAIAAAGSQDVAVSTGGANIARLVGGSLGSLLVGVMVTTTMRNGAPTFDGFVWGHVLAAISVTVAYACFFTVRRELAVGLPDRRDLEERAQTRNPPPVS